MAEWPACGSLGFGKQRRWLAERRVKLGMAGSVPVHGRHERAVGETGAEDFGPSLAVQGDFSAGTFVPERRATAESEVTPHRSVSRST